jgi:hypothetical protein
MLCLDILLYLQQVSEQLRKIANSFEGLQNPWACRLDTQLRGER